MERSLCCLIVQKKKQQQNTKPSPSQGRSASWDREGQRHIRHSRSVKSRKQKSDSSQAANAFALERQPHCSKDSQTSADICQRNELAGGTAQLYFLQVTSRASTLNKDSLRPFGQTRVTVKNTSGHRCIEIFLNYYVNI